MIEEVKNIEDLKKKLEELSKKLEELNFKIRYILACMKYWIR